MISYTELAEQVTELAGQYTTPQQLYAWNVRGTVNLDGQPFPGLDDPQAVADWAAAGTKPGPRPRE